MTDEIEHKGKLDSTYWSWNGEDDGLVHIRNENVDMSFLLYPWEIEEIHKWIQKTKKKLDHNPLKDHLALFTGEIAHDGARVMGYWTDSERILKTLNDLVRDDRSLDLNRLRKNVPVAHGRFAVDYLESILDIVRVSDPSWIDIGLMEHPKIPLLLKVSWTQKEEHHEIYLAPILEESDFIRENVREREDEEEGDCPYFVDDGTELGHCDHADSHCPCSWRGFQSDPECYLNEEDEDEEGVE